MSRNLVIAFALAIALIGPAAASSSTFNVELTPSKLVMDPADRNTPGKDKYSAYHEQTFVAKLMVDISCDSPVQSLPPVYLHATNGSLAQNVTRDGYTSSTYWIDSSDFADQAVPLIKKDSLGRIWSASKSFEISVRSDREMPRVGPDQPETMTATVDWLAYFSDQVSDEEGASIRTCGGGQPLKGTASPATLTIEYPVAPNMEDLLYSSGSNRVTPAPLGLIGLIALGFIRRQR